MVRTTNHAPPVHTPKQQRATPRGHINLQHGNGPSEQRDRDDPLVWSGRCRGRSPCCLIDLPRVAGTSYPEAARTQVTTCISGNRPAPSRLARGGDALATHRPITCAAFRSAPPPPPTWWAPREHRQLLNTATPCAEKGAQKQRIGDASTSLAHTFPQGSLFSPEHIHLRMQSV